tara:strand:+ start:186 stop:557 length:372 start_codon:yes stop_codon:yes gene_type:complete
MGCKNSKSKSNKIDEMSDYTIIIDDVSCSSPVIKSILKNSNKLVMVKGSTKTLNQYAINSPREKTETSIFSGLNTPATNGTSFFFELTSNKSFDNNIKLNDCENTINEDNCKEMKRSKSSNDI